MHLGELEWPAAERDKPFVGPKLIILVSRLYIQACHGGRIYQRYYKMPYSKEDLTRLVQHQGLMNVDMSRRVRLAGRPENRHDFGPARQVVN